MTANDCHKNQLMQFASLQITTQKKLVVETFFIDF